MLLLPSYFDPFLFTFNRPILISQLLVLLLWLLLLFDPFCFSHASPLTPSSNRLLSLFITSFSLSFTPCVMIGPLLNLHFHKIILLPSSLPYLLFSSILSSSRLTLAPPVLTVISFLTFKLHTVTLPPSPFPSPFPLSSTCLSPFRITRSSYPSILSLPSYFPSSHILPPLHSPCPLTLPPLYIPSSLLIFSLLPFSSFVHLSLLSITKFVKFA